MRRDFWEDLLRKSNQETDLYTSISPSTSPWIGKREGNLGFNYSIKNKFGQTELYIDGGIGSKEENKKTFDKFFAKRAEIETDFGKQLNWERLDNKRACRISVRFNDAGLVKPEHIDKLQDNMINAMINLESAFRKHIDALKK